MPIEQFTEQLTRQEMNITIGSQPFGWVYPQGDVPANHRLHDLLRKLCEFKQILSLKPRYVLTTYICSWRFLQKCLFLVLLDISKVSLHF